MLSRPQWRVILSWLFSGDPLVGNILGILQIEWRKSASLFLSFQHVVRESNIVADALARAGALTPT